MSANKTSPRQQAASNQPLLSQSSILILCGFLIGIASQNFVAPIIQLYIYLAGAAGILAFAGLKGLLNWRRKQIETIKSERALMRLEHRIDRHIRRQPVQRISRPIHSPRQSEHQYVPVVRSTRRPVGRKRRV